MWRRRLLFFFLLGCQLSTISSKELEIFFEDRVYRVDSKENRGRVYYELKDLAKILELSLQEKGGELILTGHRGRLVLSNGRPLVRFENQYVLLSAPLWKRKERNWYAPEDLLTKALPLILSQKLEKLGEGRYRVESLELNLVEVQLANHPEYVRIVFRPDQKAPIRVQEFANYVRVEFTNYLVRPILPSVQPDPQIVASLEFDSLDVYGAFLIHKGDHYYQFREFTLSNPDRKVVDVYAPPAAASRAAAGTSVIPLPTETLPSPVEDAQSERGLVFQAPLPENTITIDPGHGGGDYGVHPSQETAEKSLALEIAERIRRHLEGTRYRGLLTRSRDVEIASVQRSSVANRYRSKAYVSVHTGGAPRPEATGPVVYINQYPRETSGETEVQAGSSPKKMADSDDELVPWEEGQKKYLKQSRQLAELIQDELNGLNGSQNQVVEVPLAVLAPVTAPAVLIEAGFLTNPEESEKLIQAQFQDQTARAIVAGLLEFLK